MVRKVYHMYVLDELESSFEHATKADLCLSCGSSLTVTPAADIPTVMYDKPIEYMAVHKCYS